MTMTTIPIPIPFSKKKPQTLPPLGAEADLTEIGRRLKFKLDQGDYDKDLRDFDLEPPDPGSKTYTISAERYALLELYEKRMDNPLVRLAYEIRYLPYPELTEIAVACYPKAVGEFCSRIVKWAIVTIEKEQSRKLQIASLHLEIPPDPPPPINDIPVKVEEVATVS